MYLNSSHTKSKCISFKRGLHANLCTCDNSFYACCCMLLQIVAPLQNIIEFIQLIDLLYVTFCCKVMAIIRPIMSNATLCIDVGYHHCCNKLQFSWRLVIKKRSVSFLQRFQAGENASINSSSSKPNKVTFQINHYGPCSCIDCSFFFIRSSINNICKI